MTQASERAFQPFKNFELRGWRDVAERYDTAFGGASAKNAQHTNRDDT